MAKAKAKERKTAGDGSVSYREMLSSPEEIIADARSGRMFILVDDEERENEGDLIIPAQMATPDNINFMAKNGRGLICLAMTAEQIERLGLPAMSQNNRSRHETAFTVSIEAREGISTGISAPDRAHTIAVAVNPANGPDDIVTPGHVFPLKARDGGVLVRAGHTEAAVDVARLAGLIPAGVICEIMKDDGTMARLPELVDFAKKHKLKIGTIADLIAYRLRHDRIVRKVAESTVDTYYGGEFDMAIYANIANYAEHIALVKGDVTTDEPVMVRVHAMNILNDLLGADSTGKARELHKAMQMIGEADRGVVVIIRERVPSLLSEQIKARESGEQQEEDRLNKELRDYGIGAQILLDLGVQNMIILSNTEQNISAIEAYGLRVAERRAIKTEGPAHGG